MATRKTAAPLVAIVMGSSNDWDVMQHAARQLKDFGVSYEARALSAHRTPELLAEYVNQCVEGGTQCFIAGAGGAAHLAGVIAALTTLPVLRCRFPPSIWEGSTPCCPWCRCRKAFRSPHLQSATAARPTPDCSRWQYLR